MLNSREKISQKKRKRESTLGTHETLTKDLTFMTREAWGGGRERAEEEKCSKKKKADNPQIQKKIQAYLEIQEAE